MYRNRNSMENIKKLCRVCLCDPRDIDMIYLSPTQIEKIIYVGDSSVVRSDELPAFICIGCESKLDDVYNFVTKLNLSKLKLNEHFDKINDPCKVADLKLEAIDVVEDSSDQFVDVDVIKTEDLESGELENESPFNEEHEHELQAEDVIEPNNDLESIMPKTERNFDRNDESAAMCRIRIKSEFELTNRPNMKTTTLNEVLESPSIWPVVNSCHICKKGFSTRANMLRHVHEHMGRRYTCEYPNCNSYFTQRSSLQVHIARHKGLKPYKCELCHKSFSQSKSLVLHIRVHTGESPYECDYCQKAFKQKSNLVRHFRCHRKPQRKREDRFKCRECGTYLASKQSLIRHELRHQRLDQELKRLQSMKVENNLLKC